MESTIVGIRGAIDVPSDTKAEIAQQSIRLVKAMFERNDLSGGGAISLIVSVTSDLVAFNPATAVREAGFPDLPLFCVREAEFDGSPRAMLRMLLHAALPAGRKPVHVYLDGAAALRPDLARPAP